MKKKQTAYEAITKKIIRMIEKTKLLPWQIPWGNSPANYLSKRPYSGINAITTNFAVFAYQYSTPWFLTEVQIEKLGGRLKARAKEFPILFYAVVNKKANEQDIFAVWYTVYNLDDVIGIGIDPHELESHHKSKSKSIKACDGIVANMPKRPAIHHGGSQAYYNVESDFIKLPYKNSFRGSENYYSTLFHELSHSTGHKRRLNRRLNAGFYDRSSYGKEELVAELGAAFLCQQGGIENKTIKSNAAYLKAWLREIKKHPRHLIFAAGAAQKSTDFILGRAKAKRRKIVPRETSSGSYKKIMLKF